MNEPMNSYERVMCVLDGKKPDVSPVVPIVSDWCSVQAGIEFADEMVNVEKHVYSQSFCVSQFGYDAVWDIGSRHSESEAMGSVLNISKGKKPYVEDYVLKDYKEDLPKLKLFDPYQNKRLSTYLEQTRRLKSRFQSEIPVIGYVQAPFRHAAMLREPGNIMKDMYRQRENLRELLELALNSLVVYAVAVLSAGADIVFMSDPTSSGSAISKKQWESWGFPYLKRLVGLIKRNGVKTILHICGDTSDRLESMADTGVDCLSLDEAVDFEHARKTLGPSCCLMGNINTSLMSIGDSEAVKEATREVIEKAGKHGNLLVSGGCGLSSNVPPENMRAMVKAAKEIPL
ncbi:MAG: uroporphyrinogen decarboxylase family protein [Methanosarcinaceae archaeon]|nr:uroporphyrinogen decarboxylase family protein [Methanosarcinaceae archaeon]